jgi:general secretion pathway protein G
VKQRDGEKGNPGQGRRDLSLSHRLIAHQPGFSLIELVITVTVLAILTLGTIPLVQVSVKRQKEQQLRDTLRMMREAIDQFHREALAAPLQNQMQQQQQQSEPRQPQPQQQQQGALDPRIRVYVSDQTMFTVDNPDRYPPTMELLTSGVSVMPLNAGGLGKRGNQNYTALQAATEDAVTAKTKVYLREIPIDPITGKADWDFRSCYQAQDETSWDGINIFNVHSKSKDKALNGTNYSDW